jgi:ATP-dependent helicase/DNAse subunit B
MATHRLITSVSLARLETALFHGIVEQKQGDPLRPVVVLCGSSLLGHYLSRELARRGSPHACISFLTFNELAGALARQSLLARKALPLPEGGKELIARELIRSLPPESYFRQVKDQPHLPQVLAATFTDIEDSRIDLGSAMNALPARRDGGLAQDGRRKLNEVAQLYRQYASEIGDTNRMFTEAGLLAEAAQQAANFHALYGTGKLLVYGFYEMTGAQRELLRQLAAGTELTAFLLTGESSRALREWWQPLVDAEEVLEREAVSGSLTALRASVFTGKHSAQAQDDSVQVLSCPHEVSEARAIAREAIRLKREQGIPFPEMAVLARDAATYLPLLAGVFQQIGLPFYVREGLPLSTCATGRSILAALRLLETGYRRGDVMQWLTAGAADTRTLTADGSEAPLSLWDRISADAGVVQGETQWCERLPVLARAYQEQAQAADDDRRAALEHRARQAANLSAFMQELFAFGSHCRQQQSWSELAAAATAFLRRFHAHDPERDEVEDALASLGELDRLRQPASLAGFIAAAEQALAGVSRTRGAFQQTGVHLLTLAAARHTRFRVVFVPGLIEGSFPVAGRQDPILLDEERRALSVRGGAALPLKSARPQEERFLFHLALEAADERVVLSMPRTEAASGAEKMASHYLLQAVEFLAGRPIHQADLQSPTAPPPVVYIRNSSLLADDYRTALDAREFDLRAARAALVSAHPADARYLERVSPNFARAVEAEQAQWGSDRLTVYDGLLATPECRQALAELFSGERVYAPTALERYAACPYRFFLNDVLRLRDLEEPELVDEIDARDKGELMHAILRDFYAAMKAQKKLPLAAEHLEAYRASLADISQKHFKRVEREGLTGPSATWALKQQYILQDLERHVRSEIGTDWLPEDFERAFGGERAPGFEMPIEGGTIKLRGQIDRIDLSPDRAAIRVVDYKSGQSRYKLKVTLLGGKALQLPLYLLAAASFYRHIDLARSSAEYCHITRRGEWKTCTFPGATLAERREELAHLLQSIVSGCREGVFPHCPDQKPPMGCANCEYARIGDPRREKLWERKHSDPRLASFLQMREVE